MNTETPPLLPSPPKCFWEKKLPRESASSLDHTFPQVYGHKFHKTSPLKREKKKKGGLHAVRASAFSPSSSRAVSEPLLRPLLKKKTLFTFPAQPKKGRRKWEGGGEGEIVFCQHRAGDRPYRHLSASSAHCIRQCTIGLAPKRACYLCLLSRPPRCALATFTPRADIDLEQGRETASTAFFAASPTNPVRFLPPLHVRTYCSF